MYAFVDQPVASLAPGARFLIWAMRGWTHAVTRGCCPPGQLAPGFARHGALPALPHLHRLLAELNRHGRGELGLAPLPYALVTDDEAVLLQLWHDAGDEPVRARATLALLLAEDADEAPGEDVAGVAFDALLCASARLAAVGLGQVAVTG